MYPHPKFLPNAAVRHRVSGRFGRVLRYARSVSGCWIYEAEFVDPRDGSKYTCSQVREHDLAAAPVLVDHDDQPKFRFGENVQQTRNGRVGRIVKRHKRVTGWHYDVYYPDTGGTLFGEAESVLAKLPDPPSTFKAGDRFTSKLSGRVGTVIRPHRYSVGSRRLAPCWIYEVNYDDRFRGAVATVFERNMEPYVEKPAGPPGYMDALDDYARKAKHHQKLLDEYKALNERSRELDRLIIEAHDATDAAKHRVLGFAYADMEQVTK